MLRLRVMRPAVMLSLLLAATAASAGLRCDQLAASIPLGDDLQSISAVIVPAAGANAAYCRVDLKSLREINIRVGLPLSAADGGTGGVQGAWNSKLRNLGGGGTVGNVGAVTTATNTGYVGSSTDSGHNNAVCAANGHPGCAPGGYGFVLDAANNLIWSQLEDFSYVSVIEQVRWAARLAEVYYGVPHSRNYWDGCSTGGRQGMEMAQRYGDLFDGILAGVPAMNFNRFVTGSLWIGTILNEYFGSAGLSTAKINAANAAAVAACDAQDGIVDGIVNGAATLTRFASWLNGLFDSYIIDGIVNAVANVTFWAGNKFRRLQTGNINGYLFVILIAMALAVYVKVHYWS